MRSGLAPCRYDTSMSTSNLTGNPSLGPRTSGSLHTIARRYTPLHYGVAAAMFYTELDYRGRRTGMCATFWNLINPFNFRTNIATFANVVVFAPRRDKC